MTRIAIGGITVVTASLVVLLSTFNGIESMIEQLYSDFDPDITVKSSTGKTFYLSDLSKEDLSTVPGIQFVSRMVEEVVVVKHEQKWVNASLIGIDEDFLKGANISKHLVEGTPTVTESGTPQAMVGARLFDQLNGYLPQQGGKEQFILYAPKREARIRPGASPFSLERIDVSSRFDYNKEVNSQVVLVPFAFAQDLYRYNDELTGYGLFLKEDVDLEKTKGFIQQKIGPQFEVKTSLEKNALIFKTSKTEKVIVIVILLFVFILASFNLVASITMIFVEKKDNVQTLICLGANKKSIERLFFIEGLLISSRGVIFGLIIGYLVCLSQLYLGWLVMPGTNGQIFPIVLSVFDGLIILFCVVSLSILFSYFPVRTLVKKNFSHIQF